MNKALNLIGELPADQNWYIAAESGISIQQIEFMRVKRLQSMEGKQVRIRFSNNTHGTLLLQQVDKKNKRAVFESPMGITTAGYSEITSIEVLSE
jgi:hypothetical protein